MHSRRAWFRASPESVDAFRFDTRLNIFAAFCLNTWLDAPEIASKYLI